MLSIVVPASEWFNEETEEYRYTKEQTLQLEHSLVSLSKWESKWKKPFLDSGIKKIQKTKEEMVDYIRCMTITQNVDPLIYNVIGNDPVLFKRINDYINDTMTATWFSKKEGESNRMPGTATTSELIYYWMISLNIPFECQKWHLNRLLTLIRVCSVKNQPPKKMSNKELAMRNTRLNEQRLKQRGRKG